jgi:hypothetical protein
MVHVASLLCRHVDVRRTGHGRMWMECLSCGRRTPGIDVTRRRSEEDRADTWRLGMPERRRVPRIALDPMSASPASKS